MSEPWVYSGELVRVIDGDTAVLRVARPIDFGFRMAHQLSAVVTFRLTGIDTPELVGATRAIGERARDRLHDMLTVQTGLGEWRPTPLRVLSLGEPDKYGGRWDARVLLDFAVPLDVGELLVRQGYAQSYSGKGPRPTWDPAAPYPLGQESSPF